MCVVITVSCLLLLFVKLTLHPVLPSELRHKLSTLLTRVDVRGSTPIRGCCPKFSMKGVFSLRLAFCCCTRIPPSVNRSSSPTGGGLRTVGGYSLDSLVDALRLTVGLWVECGRRRRLMPNMRLSSRITVMQNCGPRSDRTFLG